MIWSVILRVLLQLLAVGVALLVALLDYFWHDKRTSKFKSARIALIIVSLFLLVVSIVVTVQDERQKSAEREELVSGLNRITNELTGGDSYPYVQFSFPSESDNLISAWLMNGGDYPLYDTRVRIVDLHMLEHLQWQVPMPDEEVKKAETLFTVGTVGPGNVVVLADAETPAEVDAYGYNVWIYTRNRQFIQEARFRRIDGRWKLAHRLFEQTDQGHKLIFEDISDSIPILGSTEDIWDFQSESPE